MTRSAQIRKRDTVHRVSESVAPLRRGMVGLVPLEFRSAPQAILAVKRGLPYSTIESLRKGTHTSVEQLVQQVGIAPRTLARRKIEGRFHQDESERLLRFAGLFEKACDLFEGDIEATKEWFSRPNLALGGETPADYAKTEIGAREVENLICRLEHGVFS